MGYRVFSTGQYKIRQRGKRYYLYKIENDHSGNVRETYVGPLADVVETYEKMKENSSGGLRRYPLTKWTGRDLNPGPPGCQPGTLPG